MSLVIKSMTNVQELQNKIGQAQKDLSDLYTRLGEARGVVLGERKQLEREISEISSQILCLQQETKGFDPQKESHALKQLEDKQESLTNEMLSLHENLNDLLYDLAFLQSMAREEESYLTRFKDFDGSCPLLADILEEKIACRTAEVLEAISGIQTAPQETRLTEKTEATQKEIETLQEQIKSKEAALTFLEGVISFHKGLLERFESNQQKIAELQRRREQAEKKRFLGNKFNKVEVLTLALSPKGIMEDLLAGALSQLLADPNQVMHQLSGGRYTIDIAAEEGFHIYLCDHLGSVARVGDPCPGQEKDNSINGHALWTLITEVGLASNSEQFRVGIVLQAVLSELAGLRFMLIYVT